MAAAAFDQLLFATSAASAPQSGGFVQNCPTLATAPVGDYVYVYCHDGFAAGGPSVTDDAGNTYTQLQGGVQNNGTPYIFRGKVTTQLGSGQNIKVTWANNTTYRVVLAWSANGIDLTTPLDVTSGAFTAGTFGLGPQNSPVADITPAVGSIMFALVALDANPETVSVAGPFTKIGQAGTTTADGFVICAGYYVLPSSVATHASFSWTANSSPDVHAFADKAAPAGGGSGPATVNPPQHLAFGTATAGVTR